MGTYVIVTIWFALVAVYLVWQWWVCELSSGATRRQAITSGPRQRTHAGPLSASLPPPVAPVVVPFTRSRGAPVGGIRPQSQHHVRPEE